MTVACSAIKQNNFRKFKLILNFGTSYFKLEIQINFEFRDSEKFQNIQINFELWDSEKFQKIQINFEFWDSEKFQEIQINFELWDF